MSDLRELNMDELEQVTGGEEKKVWTGTLENAAVRPPPGAPDVMASLPNGTIVNTIGTYQYDSKTKRNWIKIEFIDKHGFIKTGWIAASILGYPR